ncbi:Leucine-rich repeats and immunoglobulin-like domains protein 3 [Bulinus truncatus]|nr:Leucine-rich repeats and immunoglobulin-like domains protein 3 [Bulinus truncatus]
MIRGGPHPTVKVPPCFRDDEGPVQLASNNSVNLTAPPLFSFSRCPLTIVVTSACEKFDEHMQWMGRWDICDHNDAMTGSLVCCLCLVAIAAATAPLLVPAPTDSGQDDVAQTGVEEEDVGGDRTREEEGGEGAKQPCPGACECYWRPIPSKGLDDAFLTVNCSRKGLVEFPAGLPEGTAALDLSRNKLQNVSSLPRLVELRALDLSGNWIRQLDNHWVFEHVSKLRTLSLADNALTALQHGTFSGLNDLRELDLSRNVIRMMRPTAFTGLENPRGNYSPVASVRIDHFI